MEENKRAFSWVIPVLAAIYSATVTVAVGAWGVFVVTLKFIPTLFTTVYGNPLIIMGMLGGMIVGFTFTAPASLHPMAFNFTVPYALGAASMAQIFAKRSAGGDKLSLNAIGLLVYALGSAWAVWINVDVLALFKESDPTQLFETFGIGLIAAALSVAATFSNASKD